MSDRVAGTSASRSDVDDLVALLPGYGSRLALGTGLARTLRLELGGDRSPSPHPGSLSPALARGMLAV